MCELGETFWRARALWKIIQIGGLIASPENETSPADEYGYVTGAVTYAWWYRPLVALAFWLCRPK
jgi:hypothetical protein